MSVLAAYLPLAAAYSFSAPGAHMRALGHPVVQGRTVANVAMEIKTATIAMPALSSTMSPRRGVRSAQPQKPDRPVPHASAPHTPSCIKNVNP